MTQKLNRVITCLTRRHKSASTAAGLDLAPTSKKGVSAEDGTGRSPPGHPGQKKKEGAEGEKTEEGEEGAGGGQMEAVLSTLDLVSLGVGSCLGTGMYLTAGLVAATMTGPGGVVSLLLAGAASMLTGVCFAELAGLCPHTSGSAYMYAYVTVGELAAFVTGWGLLVEYVIGTAAGAVALSETLDSLSGGLLSSYTGHLAALLGLSKLDLTASVICLLLTLLLASGAEMSAKVNNGLNLTNVLVLLFFLVASAALGSAKNWGAGGFFPFGMSGVIGAIPTCYFAFIGFDTVAATGAEARNPRKSVPRSILLAIAFNCLAYVLVLLALTFDLPFYMLHADTAMTDVFSGGLGFRAGKYVVAVGAVAGEFAATFGSMFPLPRVLTAMAEDGLIFRQLAKICPKRHSPVRATLLSGLVAMVMSTFFRLDVLIELVLTGTLLAYIMVTFSLLVTRYIPSGSEFNPPHDGDNDDAVSDSSSSSEDIHMDLLRTEEKKPPHKHHHHHHHRHHHRHHQRRGVSMKKEETSLTSPTKDSSSMYQRLSPTPRKQPNMGRSEYSPSPSSSKRVTFEAPAHHSRSNGAVHHTTQTAQHRHTGRRSASVSDNDDHDSPPSPSRRYTDPNTEIIPFSGEETSFSQIPHRYMTGTDDAPKPQSPPRRYNTGNSERVRGSVTQDASSSSSSSSSSSVPRQTSRASFKLSGRGWFSTPGSHSDNDGYEELSPQSSAQDKNRESVATPSSQSHRHHDQNRPTSNGVAHLHSVDNNSPGNFPGKQKSDVCGMLTMKRGRQWADNDYDDLPLWLKLVTDAVAIVSATSARIVCLLCAIYGTEIALCVLLSQFWRSMADGSIVSLGLLGILSAIFIMLVGILSFLPQSRGGDSFRIPLVPALPVLVAFVNLYLLTSLSPTTWLLFGFWMLLGLALYGVYGMSHSQAGKALHPYTRLALNELTVVLDDDDDDDDDDEEEIEDLERSLLVD